MSNVGDDMVNAALEKFILKFSAVIFLLYLIILVLILGLKGLNLITAVIGFALGVLLFEATAYMFSCAPFGSKARTLRSGGVLTGAFVIVIAALFIAMRTSDEAFWCLFGGVVTIPAAVMIYIVLEAIGLLHTDFFT